MYLAQVTFGNYDITALSKDPDKAWGLVYKDYKEWCQHNDEEHRTKKDFEEYFGRRVYELEVDQSTWL